MSLLQFEVLYFGGIPSNGYFVCSIQINFRDSSHFGMVALENFHVFIEAFVISFHDMSKFLMIVMLFSTENSFTSNSL